MHLPFELDTLALVGITIIVAFAVGQLFRRIGIPQVVGFIIAGALLGPSFLHLIPEELNSSLLFISEIALGLIGFEMGGHLRFSELRKMGRSILLIVLLEAFGAFVLVGGGIYLLTNSLHTALIFGALASATAPAATVDVLAEYQADGPLTITLLAVIGLDDAISLLLFSVAAAVAESLLSQSGPVSVAEMVKLPFFEIGGSLVVGLAFGLLLSEMMKRFHLLAREHDAMVIPVGLVFVCAGLSRVLDLSPILTTMTLGMVVVNRTPQNGTYIQSTIEQAGPIIYVLFFALVGARLHVDQLMSIGLIGIIYIVLRSFGKYIGAWAGGTLGGAEPAVRQNLGLALLTQGGVAIGLALATQARFGPLGGEAAEMGRFVLNVITATTVVVEILGPVGVKLAITRAGEVGRAQAELPAE